MHAHSPREDTWMSGCSFLWRGSHQLERTKAQTSCQLQAYSALSAALVVRLRVEPRLEIG